MELFLIFQLTLFIIITIVNCRFPKISKMEPLVILNDLSAGHNVVGKKIELECQTTFYAKHVTMEWKTPQNVIHKDISLKKSDNSSYVTTSTLVIHKSETQDSGLYSCEVIQNLWNLTVATKKMWITVYGPKDHIIEIDSDFQHVTEKSYAEIEIFIKAHPRLSVSWINSRQQIIENSSDITISLTSITNYEEYNYKATLTFNYFYPHDEGLYMIIAENGFEQMRHSFGTYSSHQINVNINLVNINEDKMTATYMCRAIGSVKPTISWIFKPCGIGRCLDYKNSKHLFREQLKLNESFSDDRGLQTDSYVSVNLTDVGILECHTQKSVATETVFYIYDGFELFLKNKRDSDNIKNQRLVANYRQIVEAFCSRSFYKYTSDILWYHNDQNINTKKSPYFWSVNYTFPDKAVDKLIFYNAVENQLGNFSCRVLSKTGEVVSKTVEVVFKNISSLYPKVSLQDLNGGHTTAGLDIRLVCNATHYSPFSIVWMLSRTDHTNKLTKEDGALKYAYEVASLIDQRRMSTKDIETVTDQNMYFVSSYLTISSANVSETGYYGCRIYENVVFNNDDFIWIRVYDVNDTSLILEEKSNFDAQNMSMRILMTAHPKPSVKWFDNHGTEIVFEYKNTSNFLLSFNQILDRRENDANYEAILTLKSFDTNDFGNYTIVAKNIHKKISRSVQVNVTGVPTPKIQIHKMSRENATFKCSSVAYPKPKIEWYFERCTTLKSCLQVDPNFEEKFVRLNELWNVNNVLENISYVTLKLSERGVLVCRSVNALGQNYTFEPILGHDSEFEMYVENANEAKHLNKTIELVGKKDIKLICAASTSKYTGTFAWTRIFYEPNRYYTYINYLVETKTQLDFLLSRFYIATIPVGSPSENYYCCTVLKRDDGFINSHIVAVKSHLSAYVKISKSNMANKIVQVDVTSKWAFYCYGEGFPKPTVKWYKDSKIILNSEKYKFTDDGQVLEVDYVVPDDEGMYKCQVSNQYSQSVKYSLLHVDTKHTWLYVQASLVLGALLFIAVLTFFKIRKERKIEKKLHSVGLFYSGKHSVGKINPKLSIEEQAALLPFDPKWEIPFEKIKMGEQLGSGAFGVTFQATVVNYFPDDSNKTVAVKTVNPDSGFECLKALVSELKILSHLGCHLNIVNFLGACTHYIVKDTLYVVLEFCPFGNVLDYIRNKNFIDQKNYDSDKFVWTRTSTDTENCENKNSVSSKDFLIWSFQVAKGMEYLSFRRVVHGDLAARNVLLSSANVVKVCDFGLAKNVYNYGKYVRRSQGPLPLKWMPVEAIEKGIYSMQSDVWSFGIVLWEFFSLGKTPYSCVVVDEYFCKKLINGYRLESPETATSEVYDIMLACWQLDPTLRPSFSDLAQQVGSLLEERVAKHYIEMNNPYIVMNKKQFDGGLDYLRMASSINYSTVVSRLYENYYSS